MIPYKNKYGIVEIRLFFGCFQKRLVAKVGIPESIVFFQRGKAIFL